MRNITAADTIRELSTIFGRFGIPITMRADNGPQLSNECRELRQFCEELNIELVNTIPYWPQANGEVERQNRNILKRLRIAQELGNDWRLELRKFLLAYHSTMHTTTGKSPSELMFGRRIMNKLTSIPKHKEDEEVRDRDKIVKQKGKEYADNKRKARNNEIAEGDLVYAKRQKKEHKLATDYSSELFKVIKRIGSEVTIKSLMSGNEYKRYVSHLKKAEAQAQNTNRNSDERDETDLSIERGNSSSAKRTDLLSENLQRNESREEDTSSTALSEKRRSSVPKKFKDYVPF
ncbi:uncharacterized protein LOC129773673 [Toxorhynchites rutilus septentrionalis]|uniref:uncharacterized protein LOC129773673 n=1 Tax=Toxorhynchites rutilus septentrionalis TaxID=329112 RepID=UPI002478DE7F|nr:uncharacterized protein LOC129773673 [Toxorhynchites rutilus septentrionalis]